MKKGNKKGIVLMGIVLIVFLSLLIAYPLIMFHNNESALKTAAEKYFELSPSELPTGERVKTLSLATLYREAYLKKDVYIPYTKKLCSVDDSWVKVRKEDGKYKYYTYLKCGIFSSQIDHTGPKIELNGGVNIQIGKGETYTDPGIKSVVDKVDGSIKVSDVSVKSDLDTSKVGIYEISYTAFDKLNNKTVVKRQIEVVQKLSSTVRETLSGATKFKGTPENNYLRLSNMLFRIHGIDSDGNVLIVTDDAVSYVNYSKIDEWLDYYYGKLNDTTKKMIVEKEYCNDILTDNLTVESCGSYTKKRKVYIPSVEDVNASKDGERNFMRTSVISWVANSKNANEAYVTTVQFYGVDDLDVEFVAYDVEENYGIRPMMTINGESLIVGGSGTFEDPYFFNDTLKAKAGSLLNNRYPGEYISIDKESYRILETQEDGTTKVISNFTINADNVDVTCTANSDSDTIVYDPNNQTSVAYFINNRASTYIDTTYFVNHEIKVPVYKGKIIYGTEAETRSYKVKLSAPNVYDLFSAVDTREIIGSYWFVNASKAPRTAAVVNLVVPVSGEIPKFKKAGVRVVAYVKKGATVSKGNGTYQSPYVIK